MRNIFDFDNDDFDLNNDEIDDPEAQLDKLLSEMTDEEKVKMMEISRMLILKSNEMTPELWSETHPKGLTCGGDKFYAKLANRLSELITSFDFDPAKFPLSEQCKWANTFTAYLEDYMSDTHIWDSFRNLYKEKYGEWLPFYVTRHDDYFTDDINLEDIKFLMWQCLMRIGQRQDTFYSPFSNMIDLVAEAVFDVLVDAVENAPAAKRVTDYLQRSFKSEDIIELRSISYWMVVRNPLFCDLHLYDQIEDIIEKEGTKNLDPAIIRYSTETQFAWADYFGPLGCRSSKYIGEIARLMGFENITAKYSDIETRGIVSYNVVSKGEKTITLADFLGEEYEVVKNSFSKGTSFHNIKGVTCALMGTNEMWNVNGVVKIYDKRLSEEKLKDGLNKVIIEKSGVTIAENRRIIDENGGQRVFCFKSLRGVVDFLGNKTLIPVKPLADGDPESVALLLSETGTRELVDDGGKFFKIKGNRFYDQTVCEESGYIIPTWYMVEDDVARYISENHLMPDISFNTSQGNSLGHKTMLENMEFIFGFLRVKPTPSLMEQELSIDDEDDDFIGSI